MAHPAFGRAVRGRVRARSATEIGLLLFGLEFARVRHGLAPNSFVRRDYVTFGAGPNETDLAPDTLERMKADCGAFQEQYWESICGNLSRAGHDFWLTRCWHGCGFWDGDWLEAGNRLTAASHEFGEVTLYVGDDGLIYC